MTTKDINMGLFHGLGWQDTQPSKQHFANSDELLAAAQDLVNELNASPIFARAKQSVFNAKARVSAAIAAVEGRVQPSERTQAKDLHGYKAKYGLALLRVSELEQQRDELLAWQKEAVKTSERQLVAFQTERAAVMAANTKISELLKALRDLLTAAEIVDGSEKPDDSDISYLQDQFSRSHAAIAAAEGRAQ